MKMKFLNFYGVVNGYLLKLYCIDTGDTLVSSAAVIWVVIWVIWVATLLSQKRCVTTQMTATEETRDMPAAMGSVPSHVTQTPLIKAPQALFTERVTSLRTASAWEAVSSRFLERCVTCTKYTYLAATCIFKSFTHSTL